MKSLTRKRSIKLLVLVCVILLMFFANQYYAYSLNEPAFFTGWFMFSLMLFLLLLNSRKKLSFLPLGSAYAWTQLHIYVGFFLAAIFFIHIKFNMPDGGMEIMLSTLFLLVSVSGVFGLWVSRLLPPRLSHHSEYVIYERIPGIRDLIREEVQTRIDQVLQQCQSRALSDLYAQHLFHYLSKSEDFFGHLFYSSAVYDQWEKRFAAVRVYLSDDELLICDEVQQLTKQKTDLDNQFAARAILKYWLFVHIPLSYILLVFVLLHILLTYGFTWSAS